MMTSSVKVSGVYKSAAPYAKFGGSWRFAKEAWSKIDGAWKRFFIAGGTNDSTFNTSDSFSYFFNTSTAVAVGTDGKIIVGGEFRYFNGIPTNRLARLNSDGTLDTSFSVNVGVGPSTAPNTIAIQSDGKIILAGTFTSFNGVSVNRIVRLNSNGTIDTDFSSAISANGGLQAPSSLTIHAVKVQLDGKILLGGNFTSLGGVFLNRVLRLNSDGSRDSSFVPGSAADNQVYAIEVQSDGKILLGGLFTTFDGLTAKGYVRLNSNGTMDQQFTNNGGSGIGGVIAVFSLGILSNGRIVVGGNFTSFNGTARGRLILLESNGTFVSSFGSNIGVGFSQSIFYLKILVTANDKIFITGNFIAFNNITRNRLLMLNSDGTVDTEFVNNVGAGLDSSGLSAAIQPDQKILVVGQFFLFNSIIAVGFIRLNSNGTRDFPASATNGVSGNLDIIKILSDKKIIIGGSNFRFFNGVAVNNIAKLNSNGTLDSAFTNNINIGSNFIFRSIDIQEDQRVVVGGGASQLPASPSQNIARLNPDGTLDQSFETTIGTGTNGSISAIKVQTDQKILVAGSFTSFNGVSTSRIVRLNSDGSLDNTFNINLGSGANGVVSAIEIQSDGKILLVGNFTIFNNTAAGRIVRLNEDGTIDSSFMAIVQSGFNSFVNALSIQSDGKILVGGFFDSYKNIASKGIARLNTDGTLDTAFSDNLGTGLNASPASTYVLSIETQSTGKILISGSFSKFNNVTVNSFIRLNATGTLDLSFLNNFGSELGGGAVSPIALQDDNSIIIGGTFNSIKTIVRSKIARISVDLSE
jgi:uncharacterized delta-60 repeat protein